MGTDEGNGKLALQRASHRATKYLLNNQDDLKSSEILRFAQDFGARLGRRAGASTQWID
jgi:hypothetical protein